MILQTYADVSKTLKISNIFFNCFSFLDSLILYFNFLKEIFKGIPYNTGIVCKFKLYKNEQ